MEDAFSRFTAELASVDAGARMPPPVSKTATSVVGGLVKAAWDASGRQASQPRPRRVSAVVSAAPSSR